MQWAVDAVGWRWGFVGIACGALGVALLIGTVVPEHPNPPAPASLRAMVHSVARLYVTPLFWRMALCTVVANGAYMAIQGLWLGPWLRDVGGLSRSAAAAVLLWGTVGMVLGSLTWGTVADRLQRHRVRTVTVCGVGLLLFALCQGLMLLPQTSTSATLLAAAFCFLGTASALNYAIIAQTMPIELTGRVSTSFNLLIFFVGFALQWGMGAVINLWPTEQGSYPVAAYQAALGACLLAQLPGLTLWLGFRPWRLATSSMPTSRP